MSYESTRTAFGILNHEIRGRYEAGEPLHLQANGRPKFHILTFYPLAYELYGRFRNRAPYMAGSFVLRAFLTEPHPDGGAYVIAGLEAGDGSFGFVMDMDNPRAKEAVSDVAEMVGYPEFRLSS